MAFESISTLKKNRVYAPVITGIAIIVAIFLARPAFSAYNEAKMLLDVTEKEQNEVQATFDRLNKNASLIADPNSDLSKSVAKIAREFNSSEILEAIMINPFTTPSSVAVGNPFITITDVKLDKGSKEPNGIWRGTATMTIKGATPEMIATYLDYLTNHKDFAFSLSNITLPINTAEKVGATATGQTLGATTTASASSDTSVNVTLGLYYYP